MNFWLKHIEEKEILSKQISEYLNNKYFYVRYSDIEDMQQEAMELIKISSLTPNEFLIDKSDICIWITEDQQILVDIK